MQYANFDDSHVPDPLPHRNRYRRGSRNPTGLLTVTDRTGAWIASHDHVEVRA